MISVDGPTMSPENSPRDLRITGEWNITFVPNQSRWACDSRSKGMGALPDQRLEFLLISIALPWFRTDQTVPLSSQETPLPDTVTCPGS